MAKITENPSNDPQLNEDDDYGLEPEDYVFVIGPDGKMKSVIFPSEEPFEYSAELMDLFELLGIDDPDSLMSHTLH